MHVFWLVMSIGAALAFLYAMYDDAEIRSAVALTFIVVICCILWPLTIVTFLERKMPHERISLKLETEKLAPKLVK